MFQIIIKKNIPNLLTIARGIATISLVVIFLSDIENKFFIVYILFLLAALTDFWDGFLARKWRVVSNFGIVADPLLDKLLVFSLLILVFSFKIIPAVLIVVLLARDVITDILRYSLIKRGIKTPAIKSAKYKTAFQLLLINFILLSLIFPWVEILKPLALATAYLAIIFSLYSGSLYVKRFIFIIQRKI